MKIFDGLHLVGSGMMGISHPFDCHVYLIDGGSELALIDTGWGQDNERILANIRAEGFDPARIGRIFLTHGHPDHAGGAVQLARVLGCEVLAAEEEVPGVLGITDEPPAAGPPKIAGEVSWLGTIADGDLVRVGGIEVRAIIVPGHSYASTCYLCRVGGRCCLFSGDTVFINGLVSFFNTPGCEISSYRRSIGKLAGLGVEALLPGHHLFTIGNGQANIDRAVRSFKEGRLPMYTGLMGSNRSLPG